MSDDQDGYEWVSVSSGTGLPGYSPGPKAVKRLCVRACARACVRACVCVCVDDVDLRRLRQTMCLAHWSRLPIASRTDDRRGDPSTSTTQPIVCVCVCVCVVADNWVTTVLTIHRRTAAYCLRRERHSCMHRAGV